MPRNEALQSVQRAVHILYAVAGHKEGRTIAQIALAVGAKANTAYRFIQTLEREHMLYRKGTPLRFFLGAAISELKQLDDERHLLSTAGEILVRTQARLPEANFVLLKLLGTDIFQRLCVEANRPGVLIRRRREFQVDFYSRASSLLFLAYSHPSEAERIICAHPFEHEGKPIWKTVAKLHQFLEKIRKSGYSEPAFPERNFFRLAVPIFTHGQEVIAALGAYISMEKSEKVRRQLLLLSRHAAREITERMKELPVTSYQ